MDTDARSLSVPGGSFCENRGRGPIANHSDVGRTTMKVAVLAGNPKPQSRTLRIAETMVETLLGSGPHETTVIDLAVHSSHVFE